MGIIEHLYKAYFYYFVCICHITAFIWLLVAALHTPQYNGSHPLGLNRKTYISENALLPGLVDEQFDASKILPKNYAGTLNKRLANYPGNPMDLIFKIMNSFNIEVYSQSFTFSINNKLISGINIYGIIRAKGVSSFDSMLLHSSITDENYMGSEGFNYLSPSILLSLASYFSSHIVNNNWLAKDLIILVSSHSHIGAICWTKAYFEDYNRKWKNYENLNCTELTGSRSGHIQAAFSLNLENNFRARNFSNFKHLKLKGQGFNGRLANLDLVNIAQRLATKHNIHTKFRDIDKVTTNICNFSRRFSAYIERFLKMVNWNRSYQICQPFFNMLNYMLTLAFNDNSHYHFLTQDSDKNYQEASYPHVAFTKYGIDSLTFDITPAPDATQSKTLYFDESENRHYRSFNWINFCRFLEGMVRSVNNLQEKFHQSYFFYLLPSYDTFISIANYYPAFVIAILPTLLDCIRIWSIITEYLTVEYISYRELTAKHVIKFSFRPNDRFDIVPTVIHILLNSLTGLCIYLAYMQRNFAFTTEHTYLNNIARVFQNLQIPFPTSFIVLTRHFYPYFTLAFQTSFLCVSLWVFALLSKFSSVKIAQLISQTFDSPISSSNNSKNKISLHLSDEDSPESSTMSKTLAHNCDLIEVRDISLIGYRFLAQITMCLGLFALSLINFPLAYFFALSNGLFIYKSRDEEFRIITMTKKSESQVMLTIKSFFNPLKNAFINYITFPITQTCFLYYLIYLFNYTNSSNPKITDGSQMYHSFMYLPQNVLLSLSQSHLLYSDINFFILTLICIPLWMSLSI